MPSSPKPDIHAAIEQLCSLHDGDRGVLAVIACGRRAIPRLKALLFKSEQSGLFETRCRAVTALRALGGSQVLMEFLSAVRPAADPVQRLGDEAVIEAAARALVSDRSDQPRFRFLLRLGHQWPYLAGVVEALGSFDRLEAIPALVLALDDDGARPAAEAALLRLGWPALRPLAAVARSPWPSAANESDGSRRKRRSALSLILKIGPERRLWSRLRDLMDDNDAGISVLACRLCLIHGSDEERIGAIRRLAELLVGADWLLRAEIREAMALSPDVPRLRCAGEIGS